MIALDTNIIIRFLVRDARKQANAVYRRFKQAESDHETLFVPLVAVLETIWVLESAYDKSRAEILDALADLRSMPILRFEKDEVLQMLLAEGKSGNIDLADLLIAHSASSCGCEAGITFDKKAAQLPFFTLLKQEE
jgi:predicted nucleic-acid-binding protein